MLMHVQLTRAFKQACMPEIERVCQLAQNSEASGNIFQDDSRRIYWHEPHMNVLYTLHLRFLV